MSCQYRQPSDSLIGYAMYPRGDYWPNYDYESSAIVADAAWSTSWQEFQKYHDFAFFYKANSFPALQSLYYYCQKEQKTSSVTSIIKLCIKFKINKALSIEKLRDARTKLLQSYLMQLRVEYLNKVCHLVFGRLTCLKELESAVRNSFLLLPSQFYFTIGSTDGPLLDESELKELQQIKNMKIQLFIHELRDIEPDLIQIKSENQSFINLVEQSFDQEGDRLVNRLSQIPREEDGNSIVLVSVSKDYEQAEQQLEEKPEFSKKLQFLPEMIEESRGSMFLMKQEPQKKKQIEKFPMVKLEEEEKQEDPEQRVIFDSVQCDICHQFPIKGTVFKCLVCSDFDLCRNCQSIYHHFHPTLQMTKASHYPTKITISFPYASRKSMKKQLQNEQIEVKLIRKAELLKEAQPKWQQIDPDSLPSREVKSPNFLSSILNSFC